MLRFWLETFSLRGRGNDPALLERDQPLSYCVQNRFRPVPRLHLPHDVGNVACDGVMANAKFARHVLVAVSGRDQPGHLQLALAQWSVLRGWRRISEDNCRPVCVASDRLRKCGFQLEPRACGYCGWCRSACPGIWRFGESRLHRDDSQSALLQLDWCTFMVFVLPESGISLRAFAGQWRVALLAEEALAFSGEQT